MANGDHTDDTVELTRDEYDALLERARFMEASSVPESQDRTPEASGTSPTKNLPKKSETRRRTKCLPVRLTPAEHAFLQEIAAQSGLKMGAYIRKKVLGDAGERAQRTPNPEAKQLAELLGHVGKIGGNINQLAKRANTDGYGAVTEEAFNKLKADIATVKAMVLIALKVDDR